MLIGTVYSVQPFSSVMDLGSYLKESWETNETAPPIPHAELLTLNELAEKLDSIPVNKIVSKLEAGKIRFNNANETLAEISTMNNLSPVEIYQIITKKSPAGKAGSGMGRKTLEQIARENNLDINQIIKILQDNNIKAYKNQILKDIAAENDMAAKDIFDLITVRNVNLKGGI